MFSSLLTARDIFLDFPVVHRIDGGTRIDPPLWPIDSSNDHIASKSQNDIFLSRQVVAVYVLIRMLPILFPRLPVCSYRGPMVHRPYVGSVGPPANRGIPPTTDGMRGRRERPSGCDMSLALFFRQIVRNRTMKTLGRAAVFCFLPLRISRGNALHRSPLSPSPGGRRTK